MNYIYKKKALAPSLMFVFMMGIVSLFSDMTHEGARSIYGAYLALAGASAAEIGFVTGLGEMLGYSLRLFTGILADKSKRYWAITFFGYAINMLAIPAIALVPQNGWLYASMFIVLERIGKAIRQPSKNTLVSFAASQVGNGKAFAIQEFLDQIGAFIGPVILFLVLFLRRGSGNIFLSYSICFAVLGIPAIITLTSLFIAERHFPNPEEFEPNINNAAGKIELKKSFVLYIIAISFMALGFADFPIITMHIAKINIVPEDTLPLLYAWAMLVDAFAALAFGWMYDKKGIFVLVYSSAISAFFSIFIFCFNSIWVILIGITMWGIGMGAQESILKSVVATIVSKKNRSSGFGFFETSFGIFWFIGSWIMGYLYDIKPIYLVSFSFISQALSIPLLYAVSLSSGRTKKLK
mgnify:CR=1 FL=1